MAQAWRADLRRDGLAEDHIERRRSRGRRAGPAGGTGRRGLGSCWIGSTLFCPDLVRAELALPPDWRPLGGIAVGYPMEPLQPRPARDPDDGLVLR